MSTTDLFVKPEHAEILAQYIPRENESSGITLIYDEEVQSQLTEAGIEDGDNVDYDFGGDPDVYVDTVNRTDHTFLNAVMNNE